MKKQKKIEGICKNCLCYDRQRGQCKVAVLHEGKEYHMPVFPNDKCHFDELGIEVKQVRWYCEDENGNPSNKGTVKMEYPLDFFNDQNV